MTFRKGGKLAALVLAGFSAGFGSVSVGQEGSSGNTAPEFDFPIIASPLPGAPATRAVPSPRQWMNAGPTQVPLNGAGRFQFEPDIKALSIAGWTGALPASARVRIAFDREGAPVECAVLSTETGWAMAPRDWDRKAFVDGICSEAMAKARFTYAPWFDVPLERGLLDFEIGMMRWLRPAMPVTLTARDAGHPVELALSWNSKGEARCQADILRIPVNGQAVCDALAATPQGRALMEKKEGRNFTKFLVYVPGKLRDGGSVSLGKPSVQSFGYGTRWPLPDLADEAFLTADDGRFGAQLDMSDLPIRRGDAFNGTVKVVMGIASDGRVKTCRPVGSSTWPAIDNATCDALFRSGRFTFAKKTGDTGLRYLNKTIRWQTEE